MMSQREYDWLFVNAAWVLVFNDAAAIYLHWLLNSHATVHWNGCPGHVICIRGTQEQDHSSDLKINSAILFKSKADSSDNESVSESVCLHPLTRVFPTKLGKIPQMKMYEVQHHRPVVRFYITLSRFRPIQVLAGTA